MGQTSVSRDEKVKPVQHPCDLAIPPNLCDNSDVDFTLQSSARSL